MFIINAGTTAQHILFAFGIKAYHHDGLLLMPVFLAQPVEGVETSIIHDI